MNTQKNCIQKDTSDTKILGGLLWTAAKLDSEEAKAGVKEAVAGQPQEYVVTTLIQACDELKAGNKEAAQQLYLIRIMQKTGKKRQIFVLVIQQRQMVK